MTKGIFTPLVRTHLFRPGRSFLTQWVSDQFSVRNWRGFSAVRDLGTIMQVSEEGFMHILRLLVLALLFSGSVGAQSSWDRSGVLHTMLGTTGAGEHSSTMIPPRQFPGAIPPLELGALDPTLAQSNVCYCIRGYRVSRDNPDSDSTRPAGYSTCQPATRFHVKDAGDLPEVVPR